MSLLTDPAIRTPSLDADILSDAAKAAARVAPQWPLKHFVASNPFIGLTDQPFGEACMTLARATGSMPLLAPQDYLDLFKEGAISSAHLASVATPEWTPESLLEILTAAALGIGDSKIQTVADQIDSALPSPRWEGFIRDEISKWLSVMFDENQTTWQFPWKNDPVYAAWRSAAENDLNAEAFGLKGFRRFVRQLPSDSSAAIVACLSRLGVAPGERVDYLHRQLMTTPGWAGYLQYLVREDMMRGIPNFALQDLLAIRLAYDAALAATEEPKQRRPSAGSKPRTIEALTLWQAAYERGYQESLLKELTSAAPKPGTAAPEVQAVFCIDVRSEVLRRHLEASHSSLQTIGFAGFFGFPVAHTRDGADTASSRCPALLVPTVDSHDQGSAEDTNIRREARMRANTWKAFQNSAASCFSFVETCGLVSLTGLLSRSQPSKRSCDAVVPTFKSGSVALSSRAALAEGALRGMGLTRSFGKIVLLCGHGAASANNPYGSSLDCGACGGHAGDVNARLAAATFNDPSVRKILAAHDIAIPDTTVFVAGLHTTTTDTIELFDTESLPSTHRTLIDHLKAAIATASHQTRRERAPSLGMDVIQEPDLRRYLDQRSEDIAQTRPEWGLANNAAFLAAPRGRSAALSLKGRVFLHDYNEASDPDGSILTSILSAPAVVASWINLQYYASRVNPSLLGAGNKVLHNVVGGLGTYEGNAGDLKAGLPLQSLHDGSKFVHEPRRLTVIVEAQRSRISRVLEEQPTVRDLVENGWIHLAALEDGVAYLRSRGHWEPVAG